MTNFNSLNNINLNQMMGNIQRNIANQQAQIVQQGQNQAAPQNQTPMQQNLMFDQAVVYTPEIFSFEMFKMDNETVVKYLQNLLKLPNSIDKFIKELDAKNLNPKALNLLVENMVNLKALGELLNQNSKEAVQKLLETIAAQSKTPGGDLTQLKEILTVLNAIQASSTNLSSNSLKELLLLYIPVNFQAFKEDVEFKGIEDDEKEKAQNSVLSILLETINFSNILCILNENENSLYIEISANENFTFDRFKKIIEVLSKEANLKTYVEFKPSKKEIIKNAKQNFKVISGGFIPTNILILSHIIVKTIFKIDNDFTQ